MTTESLVSPESHETTDDTGMSTKGLSGAEWRPEVLLDNRDIFFHKQFGREPNSLRTKTFDNCGLTIL